MKKIKTIILSALIMLFGLLGFTSFKKVNAVVNLLAAGTEINTNITGNLSNSNVRITFTTPVNLDGTNNALLIGLASLDGTVLTDARFVGSSTNVGVYDEDGVSIFFQNTPSTIGSKTYLNPNYRYVIETDDFDVVDNSKNIDKLVIIGQKGTEISTEVSFDVLDPTYNDVVDVISVSDLTISASNGSYTNLVNQSMIPANINNDATFTFSGGNINRNLVFKFKYDVVDTTANDSNAVRIALDVVPEGTDIDNPSQSSKWNGRNSLWIRGDGTHFARYSSGWGYTALPALTKGMHDIEYGRIAILDENTHAPTGHYYVYYKLDGVIVREQDSEYDAAEMDPKMFINYSGGNLSNKIYDANLSYEKPQYVSVSNLKYGGNYVGNSIPNSQIAYTYDTTDIPTYKSTVFAAKINYKAAGDSQLHLEGPSAGNWNYAGCGWLKQDNFVIYLTDANGVESNPLKSAKVSYSALQASSQHSMEYGRLAVMNGNTFTGKYHVYFKLDGKVLLGIDQAIENQVTAGGKLFVTGGSQFDFVDAYSYETPKEISVSDLKDGGNSVGNTLLINEQKNLTYSNTDHTDNYSLVFKFRYQTDELKNNQIHLSCTGTDPISTKSYKWTTASSFILNNDNGTKVHLGKSTSSLADNKWHDINYAFTQDTIYDVEYGRIAILSNGVFTGKYRVYLKINDSIVKEDKLEMPEVVPAGNVVFITADGHNTLYDINYHPEYYAAIEDINSYMRLGFSFYVSNDTYSNVKFLLGVGIDKSISNNIIDSSYVYGIEVKTDTKTVYYDNNCLVSGDLYYTLIDLGDVINNKERSTDIFNVRAYIEVDNIKYYSTISKSYSAVTLVEYYLDQNDEGIISLTDSQVSALECLQEALA